MVYTAVCCRHLANCELTLKVTTRAQIGSARHEIDF